jgi:ABC-type sugar transport system ATPase subunit
MAGNQTPRLAIRGISKGFAGVQALSGVSFDVLPGEVHGVCGENGAGKSTLMKILAGAYQPDDGTIVVGGRDHAGLTPAKAQELGIEIIYQENLLVPTMSILENVFVGHEPTMGGILVDFASMRRRIDDEMEFLGIELNPNRIVEKLSVAEQQFVKILKALVLSPTVLIMDEPTSMFNVQDSAKVLRMVRRIADSGISVIYISHFLNEVQEIADRVTVIRDGKVVNSYDNSGRDIQLETITRDMVGRPIDAFYQKETHPIGDPVLTVDDLRLTKDSPSVTLALREGEILGIAGMVGSGRTEIVRAIAGADRFHSGRITYRNKELSIRSPRDAIAAGIAHITEDRQRYGLMLGHSVVENATIVGLNAIARSWFMTIGRTVPSIAGLVTRLRVKTSSVFQEVRYLSGGNQQKVVLAKWLLVDSSVLIFDEPTRGIDIHAKTEFYKLMTSLTKQGKSIIMVSSDLPELVSMSDRVLVVSKGSIVGEIEKEHISEAAIISQALEGTQS